MNIQDLRSRIADLTARQQAAGEPVSYLERQEIEFEKWRLIHKYIHSHPFRTRGHLERSRQWREAANEIRDLGEIELLDWALLQVEVARNLERGIQDMRPRKNGPCHPLVLEYLANRKRKALAVLHFARAGEVGGLHSVNSAHHGHSADILRKQYPEEDDATVSHEDVPWFPRGQ